jgi:coproporphyrinogen III oxidase-like Fe-S oxidoreductase
VAARHTRCGRALVAESERCAAEIGLRTLRSIFLGGGTPSLMAPATVGALIERATACFAPRPTSRSRSRPIPPRARRSLPGTARGGRQPHLARRPALDDAVLRFLGREHRAAEALAAVDLAARLFARFSFDLIYGP